MREYLNPVYDLERLIGRISYKTANPRDLLAFRNSTAHAAAYQEAFGRIYSPTLLKELEDELDPLEDLDELIDPCHCGGSADHRP